MQGLRVWSQACANSTHSPIHCFLDTHGHIERTLMPASFVAGGCRHRAQHAHCTAAVQDRWSRSWRSDRRSRRAAQPCATATHSLPDQRHPLLCTTGKSQPWRWCQVDGEGTVTGVGQGQRPLEQAALRHRAEVPRQCGSVVRRAWASGPPGSSTAAALQCPGYCPGSRSGRP